MKKQQINYLLTKLHCTNVKERESVLISELRDMGLNEEEVRKEKLHLLEQFKNGIGLLNQNQLSSILKISKDGQFNKDKIIERLTFFEVKSDSFSNILDYLQDNIELEIPIDVTELEPGFIGIQVASRDSFNIIINQGWTGDWVLDPKSIKYPRVQVASMVEKGPHPRGWYLNADIVDIKEIMYQNQKRYRLFIKNAIVINSGNCNVKFNLNPVHYIE